MPLNRARGRLTALRGAADAGHRCIDPFEEVVVRGQRTRGRVAAVLAVLAVVLTAVPAGADGYPPRGVRVVSGTVDNDVLPAGRQVLLRGKGFAPRALVRLAVDGTAAGTATADASGAVTARFVLAEAGERVLAASGLRADGGLLVVSAPVLVVRSVSLPRAAGGRDVDADGAAPGLASGFVLVAAAASVLFALRARPRRPAVER